MRLSRGLIAVLAAIGAMGSMAIHMFVPAMPAVSRDLGASPSTIQLAVTLYLVGLGLGQLAAGPAADRIGRRPVLLTGLALFVAGAAASAFAGAAELLLAARLVQALGGAAAIVVVRVIVSDLSEPREAAGNLAMLMTVLLVSPAVSPVIGGAIASWGGWRAIFAVLAGGGLIAAVTSFLLIAETAPANPRATRGNLAHSYARLIRNPRFLRYAAGIACSSCALYTFLSSSPFLLIDRYRLTPAQAGLCYFSVASAGIAGTFAVRTLERHGGAFRIGIAGAVVGGALLALAAACGFDGPVALIGPMIIVGLGTGIAAPAGFAGAMQAEEGLSGTGASLAGALQMVASGLTTSAIVQIHLDTLGWIALCILLAALVGLVAAPGGPAVIRREGETPT